MAAGSSDAARTAVGSCCATSRAKLGPDSTTTGWPGPTSCPTTWDMRSIVPASSPFVALTITARGGEERRGAADHAAAAVRGNRRHDELGAVEGVLERIR